MTMHPSAASVVAREKRTRQRRRRRWAIGLGVPTVLVLFGFFGLPPIVKSQAVKRLSAELHRDVSIERIRINPLVLSVTIEGLAIKDRDGGAFTSWRRLYVNFDSWSVFAGEWRFEEIALDGFSQRVVIGQDGAFNFADLIPAPSAPAADVPPAKAPRPLRITRMSVTSAAVTFNDASRAQPFATEIGPLSFELKDFLTSGDPKAPYEFSAVTEAGETFAWKGTVSIDPVRSAGEFKIGKLSLKKYAPYYAKLMNADLLSGVLDVTARYAIDLAEGSRELSLADAGVVVSDLQIAARGTTEPVVNLPSVVVEGVSADGLKLAATIQRIALEGGRLRVVRENDGTINLLKLLAPESPQAAPAAPPSAPRVTTNTSAPASPSPSAVLPDVKLAELALSGLAIEIEDRTTPQPARNEIERLDVTVKNFSLTEPAAPVALTVSMAIAQGGAIDLSGTATREPLSADLAVKLATLPLANVTPYVESFLNLRVAGGTVSVEGSASLRAGVAGFKGDVAVNKFATVDGKLGEDFVKFSALEIRGIDAVSEPLTARIAAITLTDPLARVAVAEDKSTNLSTILRSEPEPSATADVAPAPAASPAPSSDTPAVTWSLGTFTLSNGSLVFADRSVKPGVRMALDQFSGTVNNLSSDVPQRADVNIRGKLNAAGSIAITGKLDARALTMTPDAITEIALLVRDIDLSPISPYVGTYAGYELTRGGLSVEVKTRLTQRQIDSVPVVTIKQFTFGAPTNSPVATKLPVRLGVALLKDTSGNIILDPPVKGSIDDPEFRIGRIVLRVIVNLLTKAATSPFSLIGAAFGGGGDELAYQQFAPGVTTPDDAEAAKLETLRKALKGRPALSLDISGSYDAEADLAALREQILMRQIRFRLWEESRVKNPDTPPPAELTVSPEDEARILGLFVAERYPGGRPDVSADGQIAPPPPVFLPAFPTPPEPEPARVSATSHRNQRVFSSVRSTTPKKAAETAKPAPVQFVETGGETAADGAPPLTLEAARNALLASIPVPDDDVRQLADERARKVREALLATGDIEESRLFVSPPSAEPKGARVFLQLR